MDELGVERRIHSCMPWLPGMVEATTALTLADGGIGRGWRRRYGAPSDEGKEWDLRLAPGSLLVERGEGEELGLG